ncbi:MAG: SDR family oxidoreductase [Acidobacteria bacterium]|nr:SDR family oxidoreductase [Acidobacteriota bacterium]
MTETSPAPSTPVAVVTGAGSGVGRAVAQKFMAEDWRVALVGRNEGSLRETIAVAGGDPAGRCAVFTCDVGRADDVERMAGAVMATFGQVDVLVNSAGTNIRRRAFREVSIEDWHLVMATNLHGAFYCVRAFLPGMRARGTGTVININSDVGKLARDLAGVAYVTSKFGMAGLTQSLNVEERAHGIRACSIFPRDINTPLLDKRPQPPSAEARARMVQPEDVAACVWLAASLPPNAIVEELSVYSR